MMKMINRRDRIEKKKLKKRKGKERKTKNL